MDKLLEKIYVIAGDHSQFRQFRNQLTEALNDLGLEINAYDIIYIDNVDRIRGIHRPWGYRVGTWNDRKDIDDIKTQLLISRSTIEDFIEVQL
jgi:hypothetical protein